MTAAWKSRGWNSDFVNVQPLPPPPKQENFYVARPREVLHSALQNEESLFLGLLAKNRATSTVFALPSAAASTANGSEAATDASGAPKASLTVAQEKAVKAAAALQHLETSHFARSTQFAAPPDVKDQVLVAVRQRNMDRPPDALLTQQATRTQTAVAAKAVPTTPGLAKVMNSREQAEADAAAMALARKVFAQSPRFDLTQVLAFQVRQHQILREFLLVACLMLCLHVSQILWLMCHFFDC